MPQILSQLCDADSQKGPRTQKGLAYKNAAALGLGGDSSLGYDRRLVVTGAICYTRGQTAEILAEWLLNDTLPIISIDWCMYVRQ